VKQESADPCCAVQAMIDTLLLLVFGALFVEAASSEHDRRQQTHSKKNSGKL
jgi:hypothetical protein